MFNGAISSLVFFCALFKIGDYSINCKRLLLSTYTSPPHPSKHLLWLWLASIDMFSLHILSSVFPLAETMSPSAPFLANRARGELQYSAPPSSAKSFAINFLTIVMHFAGVNNLIFTFHIVIACISAIFYLNSTEIPTII